jgi:hypothetical protein
MAVQPGPHEFTQGQAGRGGELLGVEMRKLSVLHPAALPGGSEVWRAQDQLTGYLPALGRGGGSVANLDKQLDKIASFALGGLTLRWHGNMGLTFGKVSVAGQWRIHSVPAMGIKLAPGARLPALAGSIAFSQHEAPHV